MEIIIIFIIVIIIILLAQETVTKVVEALLDAGADPAAESGEECTVLHYLVQVLYSFFGCSFHLNHAHVPFPIAMITFQSQSPDAPHLVARLLKNASTRLFELKSSSQARHRKSCIHASSNQEYIV